MPTLLLTRQETKRLLDAHAESQPKLVEELIPKLLSLGEVQKVLQQLLREQVSIRDLVTILETLLDTASANKNPVLLVEAARQALGRALVQPLLGDDGKLTVIQLDATVEEQLAQVLDPQAASRSPNALQPSLIRRVLEGMKKLLGRAALGSLAYRSLQQPDALSPPAPDGAIPSSRGGSFSRGDSRRGVHSIPGSSAVIGSEESENRLLQQSACAESKK